MTVLSVDNISIDFDTDDGVINVIDQLSFTLNKGEILGIVGESGCGKSVTAMSLLKLLPQPAAHYRSGQVSYNGTDLWACQLDQLKQYRGKKIAMIFQEPMTALNPVYTIGKQLAEIYQLHFPEKTSQQIIQASGEILSQVGIAEAQQRLTEYPHQLSGGMRQRVMIAMALACEPDILIADEPTTALDVTIQAQILALITDLQQQRQLSVIFITHDLGVIAQLCDRVMVMYAGRMVESADVYTLFEQPKHPYTHGLLQALPRLTDTPKTKLNTIEGIVPAIADLGQGCRFADRCDFASEQCQSQPCVVGDSHQFACWHPITAEQIL
ncbi:Oligopeptide transport ATP-binding protein OppD [Sinobacterium norvegicum]|uniref:ABC-type dipeptide transporter n=1 Tax=Sinobacterium norvegicum TaxID=1641715 RepID=A0ABM9AAU6_9GAMM|nr:ABC transporter ATP-binding protein [Sinobacterium norvegicum]CAH0990273.1 Oligopeptide transport ATP-binding protein OppD [Sinobacterium norvegicum]